MREVVAALFVSLDGVTESPDQWQFDHFDAEMGAAMEKAIGQMDDALMGRVTYQEWASYWPTVPDDPFASFINHIPKHVVSTTLDRVDWQNSRLVEGSLADAIDRLKRQPGRDIGVAGSPTLVRSLLEEDLLDQLTLLVHPVVVGKGKRLFECSENGNGLKRLKLVDSQVSSTGVAMLTYGRR
ncbi:MAG: dihydrofolate reductase family protein [Anaerolineae bacterium]|nr:dihydrofolate reductase family protein [Anaerolineae bacterium]